MSEGLHLDVASKLEGLSPATAVALEIKLDSYFDVVRGIIDEFAAKKGMPCVYITASVPASTLNSALQALEVNTSDLCFVDCISHTLMAPAEKVACTALVESPTMLENIVLKVEYFARLKQGRRMVVVLDSVNSFSLHNDVKFLAEFLTVLVNSLKAREAYAILLSIPEQMRPEAKEALAMVSDVIIPL
ncbi:MAG: ATPase domain-containing protein [Methanomassiliicoccales archaeon]